MEGVHADADPDPFRPALTHADARECDPRSRRWRPEPGSMLLLATGLAGMAGMRKRIYRTICGQFTTSVKPVDVASSRNVLNRKR